MSNGGTPILDYRVSFDQATGNWVPIATGIVNAAYVTAGLVSGTYYNFKVEARNAIGYSPLSTAV